MSDGLRNSGIPLGGLGTGSVELRADGYLHEWQIMNNRPWGTGPAVQTPLDTAFFGLQVHGADLNRSAVLGLAPGYDRFLNDSYAMPWLEHPVSIESVPHVPFTRLKYLFDNLPVRIELEAFSPFIPLDARNSGLPLAYFTFNIENRTSQDLTVSLFQAQRNLVGYTNPEKPSKMTFGRMGRADRVLYTREGHLADAGDQGAMAMAAFAEGRSKSSYVFHPRNQRDIWEPLRKTGEFESRDVGDFKGQIGNMGASVQARLRGGTPIGAFCQTVKIRKGRSTRITFVLAWHFPNFRESDYAPRDSKGTKIGHMYAEWFGDVDAVLEYGLKNLERLRDRSREFVDAFYTSSFPGWLLDAIAAQFTTLVKSSWWDKEGRFGIWEGLGCCGLQTTDITYYGSFPIVQFFPEIQQSQMELTVSNMEAPGKIPHMMPGTFSCPDIDHRGRIDLIPQFVLLVWRDVLWTGDLEYGRRMWPTVEKSLEFFRTFDKDGDGLPNNTGPDQTYDQFPLKGTSAFVGFLYAGALRAAADLAEILEKAEMAAALREQLKNALVKLDEQLWTGTYYRLCYDPIEKEANDGVMADQVNADWFLRQSAGEGLLPDRRIKSALGAILKHCSHPRGFLANCAWPSGGGVEIGRHTADQANWPWSGVEYSLAAHLAWMGMEKQALTVARNVWERYERAGLRFNHIECGGHYYRALSSWAIYLALTGFSCDALKKSVTFLVRPEPSRFVFATPSAWGTASTAPAGALVDLTVQRGSMALKEIHLRGLKKNSATIRVTLAGKRVDCESERNAGLLTVRLKRAIRVPAGVRLTIHMR
ncbi:hypothetical protein HQ520_16710 [bacterium]|nr:hypothetical protein [bacterium]